MGRAVACHVGQPGETSTAVSIPTLVTTPWARAHVEPPWGTASETREDQPHTLVMAAARGSSPVLRGVEYRMPGNPAIGSRSLGDGR